MENTDEHGLGHNNPPELLTGEDLTAYLERTYAEDLQRTEALMAKGEEFLVIKTDEEDAAATEFMVKVRARYKDSEASRVKEKSPYDDNAGRIHAFFKAKILDVLGLAPSDKRTFDPVTRTDLGLGPRINMAQTLFKTEKAETERKRREEEARLAAEEERKRREAAQKAEREAREAELAASRKRNEAVRAEAEEKARVARAEADVAREAENKAAEERAAAQAAAAAPMADLSRARGERGGVSSLKTFVDFRDIDRDEIDLEMLRPYFKDKAFEDAVKGWIDANKGACTQAIKNGAQPIKGVVIFEAHRSAGRA